MADAARFWRRGENQGVTPSLIAPAGPDTIQYTVRYPPHGSPMLYYWLLYFFVAFGAKVILAFAMIYILLPSETSCAQCDEETLLIRTNRLARMGFALSLGRVQLRWCPRCGWEGLARRGARPALHSRTPARPETPTRS
jgi:hypothetical protein